MEVDWDVGGAGGSIKPSTGEVASAAAPPGPLSLRDMDGVANADLVARECLLAAEDVDPVAPDEETIGCIAGDCRFDAGSSKTLSFDGDAARCPDAGELRVKGKAVDC